MSSSGIPPIELTGDARSQKRFIMASVDYSGDLLRLNSNEHVIMTQYLSIKEIKNRLTFQAE